MREKKRIMKLSPLWIYYDPEMKLLKRGKSSDSLSPLPPRDANLAPFEFSAPFSSRFCSVRFCVVGG
ncbi:hypothetical protein MtrunA17_Chr3g0096201 [Medicago truncatula]|uniref:Uncharacterized protein n=1 Tax=Medicago truncatula TaxID=3880 RepID=A0A396IMJ5_MEDTR|nr:hypothetical protein MtrunA17_Chr3g0096201 [Medicago truncatula]